MGKGKDNKAVETGLSHSNRDMQNGEGNKRTLFHRIICGLPTAQHNFAEVVYY